MSTRHDRSNLFTAQRRFRSLAFLLSAAALAAPAGTAQGISNGGFEGPGVEGGKPDDWIVFPEGPTGPDVATGGSDAGLDESSAFSLDMSRMRTSSATQRFDCGVPETFSQCWIRIDHTFQKLDADQVARITVRNPGGRSVTAELGETLPGVWSRGQIHLDDCAPGLEIELRLENPNETASSLRFDNAADRCSQSPWDYVSHLPQEYLALGADRGTLSLASAETRTSRLDGGPSSGHRPYLLLGSLTGAAPGVPVDAALLPLAPDAYTLYTLLHPDSAPLGGSLGQLDAHGQAEATFDLGPHPPTSLVGTSVYHAFLAFDLYDGAAFFASNAETLDLLY